MAVLFDPVDLPIRQVDHTLRVLGSNRIMCDHHDGNALLMQRAQKVQDVASGVAIEVTGRFIRDNEHRIVDQRPGDGDASAADPRRAPAAGDERGLPAPPGPAF